MSFLTAGLHPGSGINRLSVSREKFHVTIYVGKARDLRSNLMMFRPCYKCGSIMSGFGKCLIAAKVIYCVIYRKC